MRVVPLFETLDDLEGAEVQRALLAMPFYRERVASGGGRDQARFGQGAGFRRGLGSTGPEALTALFAEHQIPLTLFHGRGGSISRGGSTRMALLSQPPGSVAGRIRVTEQGEVIRFKYGRPAVAVFNLSQYGGHPGGNIVAAPRAQTAMA